MKGWTTKTIGELCDAGGGKVQTGPFGSQLHESDYSETGTPVVMPKDILGSRIEQIGIARISENHVQRLRRHKLAKGDIVYGRRGDIGRQALVHDEYVGWLCGTGCLRITLGNALVNPQFLHRYLQLPEVIRWIEGQAIGATMPNLNTNILRRIPVTFPVIDATQKRITAILSAYDELIENNSRRIALLEKLAEEFYREWFVRLRFPGHEKVRVIKGVPQGWEQKRLPEIADITYGFPFDGSRFNAEGLGKPIIRIRNIPDSSTTDFTNEIADDKYIVRNGDLLVGMDGEFHINHWHGDEAYLVQRVCRMKAKQSDLEGYLAHAIRPPIKHFESILMGATVGHLGAMHLKSIVLLIPPEPVRQQLRFLNDIHRQKLLLAKASRGLTQTRDKLLPRLISGKLPVENLDIQFPPGMAEETSAVA